MAGGGVEEFEGPETVYAVCDADGMHPQWLEVREGVNYVAGWRAARTTVAQLRALLAGRVQVVPEALWASVRGDGSGVVCVDLAAAEALVELLEGALRERAQGASTIRGAPRDRAA